VQAVAALLQQVQGQMKTMQLPRIDETLTALSTAAAGR
jgi:uroporphyrin-3 C-methyltransferase